jgi:Dioxygenases related to 2-nitropropane dioxygenase
MFETELTRTLKIRYPLFQAPMAGGPTTPDLVAAVSNAGGMGNLGAGYLTPEQLRGDIQKIRTLTDQPFGVNLFVPEQPEESEEAVVQMTDHLNQYRAKLGTLYKTL